MNDVFTRAGDKNKKASKDQTRQRPLHFRAVIAKPKKRERNNDCGSSRTKAEPGQFPLRRKPVTTFRCPIHQECVARETSAAWGAHAPSRAGDGALAIANFLLALFAPGAPGEGAIATTQDACAPQSQSILPQASIKCASAQAQSFCCFACIAIISRHRLLD